MVTVLVTTTVEDLERWKKGFAEAGSLRKSYGSKGARAFQRTDKPNQVVILGEYEDREKARQMFQSPEFREAVKRAGVSGQPEVTFLDFLLDVPA